MEQFNTSNQGVFNIGRNMALYYATMMFCFQTLNFGAFIGTAYITSQSVKDGNLTSGEVAAYLLYNW